MKPAQEDVKYIVYYHVHRDSGMGYVGVTRHSMEKRWKEHVRDAAAGRGRGGSLQGAIRANGEKSFDHFILEEGVHHDDITEAEKWWIIEKGTLDPYGYNLCDGGDGVFGAHFTEDERAEISERFKRLWQDPKHRHAMSEMRREMWKDPKRRESASVISKERSNRPEVRAAASARLKSTRDTQELRKLMTTSIKDGKNRPEAKEKASRQAKLRWEDASFRDTILSFQREYKNRPEVKAEIAERFKKLWSDKEYKERTALAIKRGQNNQSAKDKRRVAGPRTGKYKGVSYNQERQKWMYCLVVKGKHINGRLSSEESAARAYDDLARQQLGPGCYLNFPTDQEREEWLALKESLASKRKQQ